MKFRIRHKIFIAIMATALFSVIALQLMQRHNFEKELRRYSDNNTLERLDPLAHALAAKYAEKNNWDFIQGTKKFNRGRVFRNNQRQDQGNNDPTLTGLNRDLIPRSAIATLAILDASYNWVAGARFNRHNNTKAILLNEQTIGYLTLAPLENFSRNLDQRFAEQQNNNRTWASLAILLGALLSAFLIARNLGRPIKELNEQVQNLSDGNYQIKLSTERADELGSLTNNVNKLADTLRVNRDQRRQWISDISHELRTPVAVLRAELECIEDGLSPLDLDSIANLKSEVERINLLINDLHQLSQADSGTLSLNCFECDLTKELNDTLIGYKDQFEQQSLTLDTDIDGLPVVYCDPYRLRQVFSNLIQNTLRYTDSPGQLHITTDTQGDTLRITFEDSSPSVPSDSIERIFDRLYRVDPSRTRATGASGLGLAICASIVEAHGGTIGAEKSTLGGLAVHIELPVQPIQHNS